MHLPSSFRLPADTEPVHRPRPGLPGPHHLGLQHHGIVSRAVLRERGYDARGLRRLLMEHRLRPVARGWYATPDADSRAVRALALGGRTTCTDALILYGIWLPESSRSRRLHAYAPRGDSERAPFPTWVIPHAPWISRWPERDPVASLPLALTHLVRCAPSETAAVALESALRRGLLLPEQAEAILLAAPDRFRRPIGDLSLASDSGSETRVVRWLRRRRFTVEQQV